MRGLRHKTVDLPSACTICHVPYTMDLAPPELIHSKIGNIWHKRRMAHMPILLLLAR